MQQVTKASKSIAGLVDEHCIPRGIQDSLLKQDPTLCCRHYIAVSTTGCCCIWRRYPPLRLMLVSKGVSTGSSDSSTTTGAPDCSDTTAVKGLRALRDTRVAPDGSNTSCTCTARQAWIKCSGEGGGRRGKVTEEAAGDMLQLGGELGMKDKHGWWGLTGCVWS